MDRTVLLRSLHRPCDLRRAGKAEGRREVEILPDWLIGTWIPCVFHKSQLKASAGRMERDSESRLHVHRSSIFLGGMELAFCHGLRGVLVDAIIDAADHA